MVNSCEKCRFLDIEAGLTNTSGICRYYPQAAEKYFDAWCSHFAPGTLHVARSTMHGGHHTTHQNLCNLAQDILNDLIDETGGTASTDDLQRRLDYYHDLKA